MFPLESEGEKLPDSRAVSRSSPPVDKSNPASRTSMSPAPEVSQLFLAMDLVTTRVCVTKSRLVKTGPREVRCAVPRDQGAPVLKILCIQHIDLNRSLETYI